MVITSSQMGELELPDLPPNSRSSSNIIRPDQFTRKKLKIILHLITGELKARGTKTPHIFLPFRSKIDDSKLETFLYKLFPGGELIDLKEEERVNQILKSIDEFTLICGLKYLWSRLPNHEIIGWSVYLEYKRKEKEAGYPKSAFLSIMPKCLSSPAHASIVYDFLDLLISVTSNSQYNYLSGRKIAKMSSLWAFNGTSRFRSSPFYDATINKENNFIDGLDTWKSSSDALFHLLLSFLRAMLPDNEQETLKLPKTLQSLLITNSYPPAENNDALKSMITIPCVNISSTRPSNNPYELLSKVRHTLSFEKKDSFDSIENYTILKNIFQKESTNEIVSTLTEESRRILNRLTSDPIPSDYDLYPGWVKKEAAQTAPVDPNIPLYSSISITNITIQDYYIWTWLSSIGSDQTSHIKKLFGRSLVLEAGLRGFQKWLIITEKTLSSDEYVAHFKNGEASSKRIVSNESMTKKDTPLPPPPPPEKDKGLLPTINFSEHGSKLNVSIDEYSGHIRNGSKDELNDYQTYIKSLDDYHESELGKPKAGSATSSQRKTSSRRPPPPPMDSEQTRTQPEYTQQYSEPYSQPYSNDINNNQAYTQPAYSQPTYAQPAYDQTAYQTNGNNTQPNEYYDHNTVQAPAPLPVSQDNLNSPTLVAEKPAFVPEVSPGAQTIQTQYLTPDQGSPQRNSTATQFYSPSKDGFQEPYELYVTEFEKAELAKQNQSTEPFDNYQIPGQSQEYELYSANVTHIPQSTEPSTNRVQARSDYSQEIQIQAQPAYDATSNAQPVYNSELPSQTQQVYNDSSVGQDSAHLYENAPQPVYHEEQHANTTENQTTQSNYQGNYFEQQPQDQQFLTTQDTFHSPSLSPGQMSPNPTEDESEEAKKAREERRRKRKEKKRKEKEKELEQEKEMAALTAAMAYGFFPPPGGMMSPFGADPLAPIPPPGIFPLPPGLELEAPKKKDKKKKKKKSDGSGDKSPSKSIQSSPETKHNNTLTANNVSPVPSQLPSPTVSMFPAGSEESQRAHPGPIPPTVSMVPPGPGNNHSPSPVPVRHPMGHSSAPVPNASVPAPAPAPATAPVSTAVNHASTPSAVIPSHGVTPNANAPQPLPKSPREKQESVPREYQHLVPKVPLAQIVPPASNPSPNMKQAPAPQQLQNVLPSGSSASAQTPPIQPGNHTQNAQTEPQTQSNAPSLTSVPTLAPPRPKPMQSPLVKANETFAAPAPILRPRGSESSDSLTTQNEITQSFNQPPQAPVSQQAPPTQSRSPMLNQRLDASLPSLPSMESPQSSKSPQTSPQSNHGYQQGNHSLPPTPTSYGSQSSFQSGASRAPAQNQASAQVPLQSQVPRAAVPAMQRPPPQQHAPQSGQPHLPRPGPQSAQPSPQPNQYAHHPPTAQGNPHQPSPQPNGVVRPQAHPHGPPHHFPQPSPQPNAHGQAPAAQGYPPAATSYPPAPSAYPPAPTPGYPSAPAPGQSSALAPVAGHPPAPAAGHSPQHYPPPQSYPQAPPQGYHPHYPPPPQGFPGYPPPQGYDPNYYPPPPSGYYPPQPYYPPPHTRQPPKQTTSDVAMRGMPSANKFNKNKSNNKANLRAAFNQGSFGI